MLTIEATNGKLFRGMTVKDLREAIRAMPPNMLVVGKYDGTEVPLQSVAVLYVSPGVGDCCVLDVDETAHERATEAIRSDE